MIDHDTLSAEENGARCPTVNPRQCSAKILAIGSTVPTRFRKALYRSSIHDAVW